jgi:transposase
MEYFAGLDVPMEETHVIVVDRDGKVILETRTPTAPKTIAAALAKGPAVERVLFETGRMAPMLFHGLTALGLPVVCVESRQAYQAGTHSWPHSSGTIFWCPLLLIARVSPTID